MFRSARVKLTCWYVLIIFCVSTLFSTALYFSFVRELERGLSRAQLRVLAQERGIPLSDFVSQRLEKLDPSLQLALKQQIVQQELKEAKQTIRFHLLVINGIILVFSAGAGYVLAGKTLRPIQKAMEEQRRFVADASHELRTPITALKTSLEVFELSKKPSLSEAKKLIADNLDEVKDLERLVTKLLELATYQSSRKQLHLSTVEMKDFLAKATKKFGAVFSEKQITFTTESVVEKAIFDAEKIKEVITILLDNAGKYTPPKGSVQLLVQKRLKDVHITVADSGSGVSPRDRERLFDRFFRSDVSRSRRAGGFGLGLSVAKEIVELHGGTISIQQSKLGGAAFVVLLPKTVVL